MRVLATAGHVDHGKSALVRALTGMEPDRWQAERDRGLTIDLGYAWTELPSGQVLAFVDVPGHERFIGNMVAGVGPAPAVMFIVSADEGWSAQSQEHLAALDALNVRHGLVVVTKSDLADPVEVIADVERRLAGTSLQGLRAVGVSARTGAGIDTLRTELDSLVASLPTAGTTRLRLWIDRAFSIRGAGTVVTGTLAEGAIEVGDEVELGERRVRVRSLQSLDVAQTRVEAPARVAVNLADVPVRSVSRGDVVLGPGQWRQTHLLDVRFTPAPPGVRSQGVDSYSHSNPVGLSERAAAQAVSDLPRQLMVHVGTTSVQAILRPLADDVLRISLPRALPLVAGDRAILRNPGTHRIVGGVLVLDADPPPLRRRGAGRRRGDDLASATGTVDLATEVARRGLVTLAEARHWTDDPATAHVSGVLRLGDYLVDETTWKGWADALADAVDTQAVRDPLEPTLSEGAAQAVVGLPERALLAPLAERAGLQVQAGRVGRPGQVANLGAAEDGLRRIEERLRLEPMASPDKDELAAAGLGSRELAAAARTGRILRLPGDIVLLPDGPARAMRLLAGLEQPFTLSQARQALNSTRRVVVPLLEHLDARGWTRRVDGSHREVAR